MLFMIEVIFQVTSTFLLQKKSNAHDKSRTTRATQLIMQLTVCNEMSKPYHSYPSMNRCKKGKGQKKLTFQPLYYNVLYFPDIRCHLSNKIIRFVVRLLHIIQCTQHNVHERETNVKRGDKQN